MSLAVLDLRAPHACASAPAARVGPARVAGRKLASGIFASPLEIVSGRSSAQPANDTEESRAANDERASESCYWTAKDPIRFSGGINLYEYAASVPSELVDPTGRDPGGLSHSDSYRQFWTTAEEFRAPALGVGVYLMERIAGRTASTVLAQDVVCSLGAFETASQIYDDPHEDKKKHCLTACLYRQCTAFGSNYSLSFAGYLWELAQGWDPSQAFGDIAADEFGRERALSPEGCFDACDRFSCE